MDRAPPFQPPPDPNAPPPDPIEEIEQGRSPLSIPPPPVLGERDEEPLFEGFGPPAPELVLDHLSQVGLYEPHSVTGVSWEQGKRKRSWTPWLFAAGALVMAFALAASGVVAHVMYRNRLAAAAKLNARGQ